jgi:ribosomal protein S27AE
MADKFKCPKCGSGRTKPLSIAIAAGTRRRQTVGVSKRSFWTSTSSYKSDLVAGLPQRPSNGMAHLLIFIGACGLLFALFVGVNGKNAGGLTVFCVVLSALFLLIGFGIKKSTHVLTNEQEAWDNRWLCARCGHQWQG